MDAALKTKVQKKIISSWKLLDASVCRSGARKVVGSTIALYTASGKKRE